MERYKDIARLPCTPNDDRLETMVRRMRSVLDALVIGSDAIPALRQLPFERDRAGIFQPRRRAIQALAAFEAFDVLREFIAGWRPTSDPVERAWR
jgi:hypothetical protein